MSSIRYEQRNVVLKRSENPSGWVVEHQQWLDGEQWGRGDLTTIEDHNWTGSVVPGAEVRMTKPLLDGTPQFLCVDDRPFDVVEIKAEVTSPGAIIRFDDDTPRTPNLKIKGWQERTAPQSISDAWADDIAKARTDAGDI